MGNVCSDIPLDPVLGDSNRYPVLPAAPWPAKNRDSRGELVMASSAPFFSPVDDHHRAHPFEQLLLSVRFEARVGGNGGPGQF